MKRITALPLSFAALFAGPCLADEKPLFVYVSPNPIGVNDFLKLGKIGTERVAQALGGVAKTYESSDPTTQRQNLESAAKAGAKVVIAIGFEFNDMLPEVASAYPNVQFLQIDSCPFDKLKPNIHCSVFREYEGAFLTGAEAALLQLFATHAGRPFSRTELCKRLNVALERSIDVQVTRLRRKIEEDPKLPLYLQTVRGVGYMLVPDRG